MAVVNPSESGEQIAIFNWCSYKRGKYPELDLLYHIPNGGLRAKTTAAKLRAEGQKAGVPDLCLPVARGGYHGLYIELKAIGGKLSDLQGKWIENLIRQGYMAVVCFGFNSAVEVITKYLEMGCSDDKR